MRIAIVGACGQLGTALQTCLSGDVVALGHSEIEVSEPQRVAAALSSARPDCVINAAAYNFVDKAEDEPELAYEVNALGPRNLARWCAENSITLVHVSTDYVFGANASRGTPYTEEDPPGPTSAYGVSKLAGEYFVSAICTKHFIVRTCGLYGRRSSRPGGGDGKGNFVQTMLRLATQRSELTVVDDQHCTPSSATDVARAISRLIQTTKYGLYHATNAGGTTWCEFARAIFRFTARNIAVRAITSAEYPQKAKRPAYSVLDGAKLAAAIGEDLAPWEDALARYLQDQPRD